MSTKYIYRFEEGNAGMKNLLGGKGANLAEMTNIGLPVPPGFIITTEACKEFYLQGRRLPDGLMDEILEHIRLLEQKLGKVLGDEHNPLLVSVRSGAPVSMPGMMDTVLNLGLNDRTVAGLARSTGDERFALDCYRRFINMFGDVVMHVEHYQFESILQAQKDRCGVRHDHQLSAADWREVVARYKNLIETETRKPFPQDPLEQLILSVQAVFDSWYNDRAVVYRKIHRIPDDLGTAVNIQTMVFGNMGEDSGSGVAFTRNPSTGERQVYGEYLTNAQGEDVVGGIRTPKPIRELAEDLPEVYGQFQNICELLDRHYRNMQDIEFTIERGRLYILQTRNGKRTVQAAIRIAVDMVEEGLISREEAVVRVEPEQLDHLLHRRIDPDAKLDVIATGLPASPGSAAGKAVFDADTAEKMAQEGEKVILVRNETTPDDIHGIVAAQGILTSRGGMTSHAAVVARGMGKPCVCGCEAIRIMGREPVFTVNAVTVRQGDLISIDGSTGRVILGAAPMRDPELSEEFRRLLEWADKIRTLEVRGNADTPADAAKAREFGAIGIGLCRTEHMFMGADRLPIVQQMILADDEEARREALEKLLPMQEADFYGILKAMDGLPVTIRLLDPPLHEFLPNAEELHVDIARLHFTRTLAAAVDLPGVDNRELQEKEELLRKIRTLSEANPMLGHRGCRLGITYPEVYAMQARAIFLATADLLHEGYHPVPEVEIPLIIDLTEFVFLKNLVDQVAAEVQAEREVEFEYTVGTMIELPRAVLMAGEIAQEAEFFSFGTNDLTQTTFGFSRDDAEGKFLHRYLELKLLPDNPFAVLDCKGVGRLIAMGIELGRATRPDLLVGICGEHGGEPRSIEFCHQVGMNYVSCSPYRVPIARLAAAQARVLTEGLVKKDYGTK